MVRKTTRPQIQVEAFVEVADLVESSAIRSFFRENGATSRGVVATAGPVGQFDYLTTVADAREFISRGQAADAGTQDDYAFTIS
jgi:hypothetical protein